MRRLALLLALVLPLAGCGSSTRSGSSVKAAGTLQSVWDRPGQNVTVVPGDADFSPGDVRYSFLVVRRDGQAVLRPLARVWVADGLQAKPFQVVSAPIETISVAGEVSRLYVAHLHLPKAGMYWIVAEPEGGGIQALGQVQVKEKSNSPMVGAKAPHSDTPTLGDAPIGKLTTANPPDRELLRWSVAESLNAHKPFVVTFATPKFCTSRTCGPVVDIVRQVAGEFPEIRFIHVEIYAGNDPQNGENRWVREWNLPSEPWVFLVGADGLVKAKFEGAVSARELRRAVRAKLAR